MSAESGHDPVLPLDGTDLWRAHVDTGGKPYLHLHQRYRRRW
ncbi:hypothetical protein [Streptomyces drozdowiczii]|nr:hypothetical protein [Streptomyces drozdowiczii]